MHRYSFQNISKALSKKLLLALIINIGIVYSVNAQNDTSKVAEVKSQDNPINADSTTDSTVFSLGEVVIVSKKEKPISSTLGAQKMQNFYRTDVAKALNMLPGINVSATGSQGQPMTTVYMRGFDSKGVPLLIDGIPIYVPNDGSSDLSLINTFDLSEVNVSKGYTSLLYGPNAEGGAINLVTRKPVRKLEINGASGWQTAGYRTNANVGSNLGKFYIQTGASRIDANFYPLSQQYTPTPIQPKGIRDNSQTASDKFNIKVGFTPTKKSEYTLGYIYEHSSKGDPLYAGSDPLNSQLKNPRYWKMKYYDQQSLYFIANTQIDSSQYIKTRLYYNPFKDLLAAYDNATYTTQNKPSSFNSYYNDYSLGGLTEYGKHLLKNKDLFKATLQYREDVHHEWDAGQPIRTMSDETMTAGFENELNITRRLLLLTGASYNYRKSLQAMNYNSQTEAITQFPKNSNGAYNAQGGLDYHLNEKNKLNFSVARKTRFATIKDRYSYNLGTSIPNPNLTAEYTLNYELGYKGNPIKNLTVEAALFYSNINHTLLTVNNVQYDSTTKTALSQVQNVGKSAYKGAELAVEYIFSRKIKAGTNYTYIDRHNITIPTLYFTNVPKNKLFAFIQYQISDRLYMQINTEYDSKRYSTSYGTTTGGYTLFNTKISVKVWKYFSTEAGVNNILDRNYATVEGYPQPGRNYFVNFVYKY